MTIDITPRHYGSWGRVRHVQTSLSQVIRPCRQLHTLEIDLCSIPDSMACQDAVLAAALSALETLSFPFLDEFHEEARRTTNGVVIQDPQG